MDLDPMSQAIIAMCSHDEFIDECALCHARRVAGYNHLDWLLAQALRETTGDA